MFRLILSRAGLVASYAALLLWVAHREEGILQMLLFGLEEIGSISEFKYEIASVLLFEMHLKEVLRAHTEVWVIHMLGRSYMLLMG